MKSKDIKGLFLFASVVALTLAASIAEAQDDVIEIIETADGRLVPKDPAHRPIRSRENRRSGQLFGVAPQDGAFDVRTVQFGTAPQQSVVAPIQMPFGQQARFGQLIGGVGFMFLKPYWSSNVAILTQNVGPTAATTNLSDFNWNTKSAPLIWVGFLGPEGFGGRVRWWSFDHSAATAIATVGAAPAVGVPYPPGTGLLNFPPIFSNGTVQATSNLDMMVWDFEGVGKLQLQRWLLTAGGGVRYVRIKQGYRGTDTSAAGTTVVTNNQRFRGTGPTLSFEARRNLFVEGLSLFANSRGSLLFGHHTQVSGSTRTPAPATTESARYSRWGTLPVIEAEVGAAFSVETFLGRWTLEAALVGQSWLGLGNASNTAGRFQFLGWAADYDATLGMLGGKVTLGLDY